MKKLAIFVAMLIVVTSLAIAEIGLSVGAKGVIGLPLGTKLNDSIEDTLINEIKSYYPLLSPRAKDQLTVNGGGSVFVRYELFYILPLDSRIGIQFEVGFNGNNGIGLKTDEIGHEQKAQGEVKTSFHVLDMPLLITYRIPLSDTDVRIGIGPNFGIVLGKAKVTYIYDRTNNPKRTSEIEYDVSNKLLMGLAVELGIGVGIGPGTFVANLRYINDFTKLKGIYENTTVEVLTRRNLSLALGYEMRF